MGQRIHTQESTASLSTGSSNPSNNSFSRTEVELSTGKVIEEEEGLSPLCEDVVDTHGNQILTNGVMLTAQLGNLQDISNHTGNKHYLYLANSPRTKTSYTVPFFFFQPLELEHYGLKCVPELYG